METEKKGLIFKTALSAAFVTGAIAFIFAFMYTSEVFCKVCFILLALLSLMCTLGMTAADVSAVVFTRTTTKLFAFLFPFSINCGVLVTEILLLKEKDSAAFITVIVSIALSVISSAVLVRRYMEDDF